MNDIIKECVELANKYGHLPFDKALPHLRKGWWDIAARNNTTGDKVFGMYMDWQSKQNANQKIE